MEWANIEVRVPKEMIPFLLTDDTSDELKRNALILYPHIKNLTLSHGRAAKNFRNFKMEFDRIK